jgi:D-alanyl-D-alanine carboxypeptidase
MFTPNRNPANSNDLSGLVPWNASRNLTRPVCLALGLALICASTFADEVDDCIQAAIARNHLPGVAVAIDQGGRTVKLAGYGFANVELRVPVTAQTVFQIQSVTKQFTATAVMMLAEQGKLSVDATVATYLDGVPPSWNAITVRHLLTHTSGIKDFINEPTTSLRLETTDEEVFRATAARPLNFQPGEKYAYSNSNYHLLAMIIRKLTGQAYGDFLQERIFRPLGMAQTRVVSWSDIIPNRAAGYNREDNQLRNGEFIAESILSYGGGGILSTAEDMSKWDLALRSERLLKRSSLDQMWSATKLNNGTWSNYGFGWGIGGKTPHRYVQHSGANSTGFTSHIVRFLDDDLSVVVLVNASFANPGKLAHVVAGLYVPELNPPQRQSIPDTEPRVTQLLRQTALMICNGRLVDDQLTPELRTVLTAQLPTLSDELKARGQLQALELLERKETGLAREYQYRLRFERAVYQVTLTLDAKGKISGIHLQED